MANLVIVESPSKAATIKGYLGSNYKVVASKGHVRDLPKSKLGVDVENDFENTVKDKNGVVYGVDITNVAPNGLLNHGTSEYVGKGQPLPIISADENDFEFDGISYNPRVIAVIYKGSKYADQAQNILYELFGENN